MRWHPLRTAELGRHRAHGLQGFPADAVQVPPARAIRDDEQLPVGRPLRLAQRLGRSAGEPARLHEAAVVRDLGQPQLGAVEGHLRMVPGQPRQPAAVG
jgi:hypothetical protein